MCENEGDMVLPLVLFLEAKHKSHKTPHRACCSLTYWRAKGTTLGLHSTKRMKESWWDRTGARNFPWDHKKKEGEEVV